jgi:prenyltransferase beta subunit
MTRRADVATACRRAGRYLLGRQCPQGGFCFYRSEHVNEPNLADTYHAVRALALLGLQGECGAGVREYLHGLAPSPQPWDLYHLTGTWRALDPAWEPDDAVRARIAGLQVGPAPDARSVHLGGWLERTRLVLRLRRDFAATFDCDGIARGVVALRHDGGFGDGPNLIDTWTALDVLQLCAATPAPDGEAQFVRGLQVPTFAFQATPAACIGRLELVWAGINCCRVLAVPVRYLHDALEFALSCQTRGGGFANAPDALPDIVFTRRALQVMHSLSPRCEATRGTSALVGGSHRT